MAVNLTTVVARGNKRIVDVEATADADTTATIPHGMGQIPQNVTLTELLQVAAAISAWAVTTLDATNVVLTKGVGVGSGTAGAQLRCVIEKEAG